MCLKKITQFRRCPNEIVVFAEFCVGFFERIGQSMGISLWKFHSTSMHMPKVRQISRISPTNAHSICRTNTFPSFLQCVNDSWKLVVTKTYIKTCHKSRPRRPRKKKKKRHNIVGVLCEQKCFRLEFRNSFVFVLFTAE